MKIIKKMKVCVAFAMLAAMVFTNTVNAKSLYVQEQKYADDFSFYHPADQEDKIDFMLRECRVTNDNVDSLYNNEYLRDMAAYQIKYKDYVFDLKLMANKLNCGLNSDWKYLFNQGFMGTDDLRHPRYVYYYIRCDIDDYWDLVWRCVDFDTWEVITNEEEEYYKCCIMYSNINYLIKYDGNEGILYVQNMFY